jgi:hypothetical protein
MNCWLVRNRWRNFHAAQADLLVVTGHVATRVDADACEACLPASRSLGEAARE